MSGEAWAKAGAVTAAWLALLLALAAWSVRRAWRRADGEKRSEIRTNVRRSRKGMSVFLPVWPLGTGVGVFVIALVIASMALG